MQQHSSGSNSGDGGSSPAPGHRRLHRLHPRGLRATMGSQQKPNIQEHIQVRPTGRAAAAGDSR